MSYKASLTSFLKKHKNSDNISFHMPGHKGMEIYKKLGYDQYFENIADMDITEIKGADNLFQTEGVLKEIQEKYKELYESKASYILVNGSSGGIISAILASVKKGKKLLVARNCHKSVFSALSLGDINPVYLQSEFLEEFGIMGAIDPKEVEKALKADSEIDTIIFPSPNYYGVLSPVREIKKIAKEYGVTVIVDQAHGAHLKFMDKEQSAEEQGADIVINSTHKTLASFTQTAVLNVMTETVDLYNLEEKLQWMQTTSPSYILMESLDINADIMQNHGTEIFNEWKKALDWFYKEANKIQGLKVMRKEFFEKENFDYTKINIDIGMPGGELEDRLIEKGIYSELYTGNILMFMTGIGTTKGHLERLLIELKTILNDKNWERKNQAPKNYFPKNEFVGISKDRELIPMKASQGRIAAGCIIPYPPGIPLICPGEKIKEEIVNMAIELREKEEKVIGIDRDGRIPVYK